MASREVEMSDWNDQTIKEFRENEGRVGGVFEGAPLLLLHTTGRRTGEDRAHPLMYPPHGARWIVFASKGGHVAHPHWLHNIEEKPEAKIEVGSDTIPVKAAVLGAGPRRGGT